MVSLAVAHGKFSVIVKFPVSILNYKCTQIICRACIIAVGVIRSQGSMPIGEFVEGSNEVWLKRLQCDEDGYHGNFDAPQSERWFENFCNPLAAKNGPSTIHVDDASYHILVGPVGDLITCPPPLR
ncbi:hypothetical protein PF010_g17574 [Phytophthora fragariae]|uniref:Uncharacterized protein n=1 Tax=Phytophthora fragariae TaxID=53985 RepID=A0A6G0KMP2_9STRA|nr:hypothetical protein PF010_g17574 [Phytophthora fragariae]